MGHNDCDGWEYTSHPQAQTVVDACKQFLVELRDDPLSKVAALSETRPFHASLFAAVVPAACPYLAGHYRGEDYDCLREAQVSFGGHVGTLPVGVLGAMGIYHQDLIDGLADLDAAAKDPVKPLGGSAFVVRLAQVCAAALTRFLTIHPYKNGNGHMARLLVWVILGRYSMLPKRWWLNNRPPGYAALLTLHRNGDRKPLEKFILECIVG